MDFNWALLFVDFSQGLVDIVQEMNKEFNKTLEELDCDKDCGKTLAKTKQLETDMNRILDFMEKFYKERGLKDVKTMGK